MKTFTLNLQEQMCISVQQKGVVGMVAKYIGMSFSLPIKITKKEKWFLAECPVLDVATQGPTEDKARQNLKEALISFLETCFDMGTLGAVLKECGFRSAHKGPVQRRSPSNDYIDVPIELIASTQCSDRCHV